MWIREFGFTHNPFDAGVQSAEHIFSSLDLELIQDAVLAAILQRQMLSVTGPAGAGKTIAIYDLLAEQAKANGRELLLVNQFNLQTETLEMGHIVDGLLRALIRAAGSSEGLRRSANGRFFQLQRLLGPYAESHEVVLVLEDAHAIPPRTLIGLKRLREMRWVLEERLLTIILIGQPQFAGQLKRLREVDIRCEQVTMTGLSFEERREYIRHKLELAGGKLDKVFTKEAVKLLCERLRWPQDINKTCTQILQQAAEFGEAPVTSDLVKKHVQGSSSLGAMLLMAGITQAEIRHRLKDDYGIETSVTAIKRLFGGCSTKDPRVLQAVREILQPTAGEDAMTAIAEKMPPVQRGRWERMKLMLSQYDYDYDFGAIAEQAKVRLNRLHQIIVGTADMTDSELHAIEVAVRHAHKAKEAAAQRQQKVA